MRSLLIAGTQYGRVNVGDDAILAAMIEQIRSVGDFEITVATNDAKHMADWLGVEAIEYAGLKDRLRTFLALMRSDILVLGGACIVSEYTPGWKGFVSGYPGYPFSLIVLARLFRIPTMVYAIGVEEIQSPLKRFIAKILYSSVQCITVRDDDSEQRLRNDYGVSRVPLFRTADPVNALSIPDLDRADAIFEAQGIVRDGRPLVGIGMAYGRDTREALVDFFARVADHLVETIDARIVFIPTNVQKSGDRLGMERVIESMTQPDSAQILQGAYTHDEVIGLLSGLDLVVASRMHLLIFATLVCTPIVGISRISKIDAFLGFFGLKPGGYTQSLDVDAFCAALDRTWEQRASIRKILGDHRDDMQRLGWSNAEYLRDYVFAAK